MSLFPANATLVFPVYSGKIRVDSLSGNWRQEPTGTITFQAYLSPTDRTPIVDEQPGVNRISELLEGYLVSPKLFPDNFSGEFTAIATVRDPSSSFQQTGEFLGRSLTQNSWSLIGNIMGTRIQGYFKVGGSGQH